MNKSKLCGIIQLKKCGSQRRKNQEWCSRFHGSKPCGLCYFDRVLPPAFFPASHIFLDIPFLRVVIFYNPSYIKNDFTDFSKCRYIISGTYIQKKCGSQRRKNQERSSRGISSIDDKFSGLFLNPNVSRC